MRFGQDYKITLESYFGLGVLERNETQREVTENQNTMIRASHQHTERLQMVIRSHFLLLLGKHSVLLYDGGVN